MAVLVGLGVIGAVTQTQGTSDAEINRAVSDSVSRSVDDDGGLDEVSMIRNLCTEALEFRDHGATQTYREMVAAGDVTVNKLADFFADGYFDEGESALSRAEVMRACIAGLNSY